MNKQKSKITSVIMMIANDYSVPGTFLRALRVLTRAVLMSTLGGSIRKIIWNLEIDKRDKWVSFQGIAGLASLIFYCLDRLFYTLYRQRLTCRFVLRRK